jgi:hypothetical protein
LHKITILNFLLEIQEVGEKESAGRDGITIEIERCGKETVRKAGNDGEH